MKSPKKTPPLEPREGLQLVSGGRLLRTKWATDQKRYLTTDVTENAPCYLFAACTLAEEVILRDLFLLLQKHPDFYQNTIGNHVNELVTEGLQPPPDRPGGGDSAAVLELSWKLEYWPQTQKLFGNVRPEFWCLTPAGQKSSVALSPAQTLAQFPVRLNPGFPVWVRQAAISEGHNFTGAEFSLGQILEAIIWELSWFGGPMERKIFTQELTEIAAETAAQEMALPAELAAVSTPGNGAPPPTNFQREDFARPPRNRPPAIGALPDRPLPRWLTGFNPETIPTGPIPLRQLLEESCFYPASGLDYQPIEYFARNCRSFIYADYGISKSQFSRSLNHAATKIAGYTVIHWRDVTTELGANEWWIATGQPAYVHLPKVRLAPQAWAMWVVLERPQSAAENPATPDRLSLLYLGQEALAAFERLYLPHPLAPKFLTILQPGSGHRGNWTRFEDPRGPLAQTLLTNLAGVPRYMIYGYRTTHRPEPAACWPQYRHCLGHLPFGQDSWLGVWQYGEPPTIPEQEIHGN